MIKATFPHMVLNSDDVPDVRYKMWNTGTVPKSKSVWQIADWVRTIAESAPDKYLQTLVINAHGSPGKIHIGQGIDLISVEELRPMKGLVERIWIVACKVARIKEAGSITDGNYFCYRLAQLTGAYVTAGSATQEGIHNFRFFDEIPYGYIDDWEGTVYTWNPKGEVVSSYTN
jgi:hypothetical protein